MPKIIVVPMLRNVDETIAGITNKNEKGLKIPPVKYREHLVVLNHIIEKKPHKNLLIDLF